MGRSIAIKLAILIIVGALAYSAFWFFKIGQVEKKINKFISENGAHISAGEVTVSGFPLSQKITIKNLKFSIPNPAIDKNEIIVPNLEATAKIFASDYNVRLVEPISVQDADGNLSNVEFAQDPSISFSINGDNIVKFSYQDSGYKMIGADKSVIYAASSTNVSIDSGFEADKIAHNIRVDVKDIEGFDVVSLYKNILEKKIIDGIKTGEVALGSSTHVDPNDPNAVAVSPTVTTNAAIATPAPSPTANPNQVAQPINTAAVVAGAPSATPPTVPNSTNPAPMPVAANPAPTAIPATTSPSNDPTANLGTAANNPAPAPIDNNVAVTPPVLDAQGNPIAAPAAIVDNNKGNLVIDLEYILTPIKSGSATQEANTPPDPTQIQQIPSQYSKSIKIANAEFSNPLYKVSLNGELSILPDDNLPSGGITIKVEKVDNLTTQISTAFVQMSEKLKPATALQPAADLLSGTAASAPMEDPYQTFLNKVSTNLNAVTKEISAKNAASKDDVAQFDLRREKNLDFLINETTIREILGKF